MDLFARRANECYRSVVQRVRVALEAAHLMSWYRWVDSDGALFGLTRFGASAPYEKIYEHLGLTVQKVLDATTQLAGDNRER